MADNSVKSFIFVYVLYMFYTVDMTIPKRLDGGISSNAFFTYFSFNLFFNVKCFYLNHKIASCITRALLRNVYFYLMSFHRFQN